MVWKLTARLLAPVCLVQNRGVGNTLPTLDYIPGTTVRGLLAQLYLDNHAQKVDETFRALFVQEGISYPNLYLDDARVIPLSALSCKYHPGFKVNDQAHGAVDGVLPWLRSRLQDNDLEDLAKTCPHTSCGAPLDRLTGFYSREGNWEKQVGVDKCLLARTAIGESREVVKSGNLYTLEALQENQEFSGELTAEVTQIQKLQDLLTAQPKGWLGTARSRGLGEVALSLTENKETPGYAVGQRLAKFNAGLHQDGRLRCFSLTLLSDAIVLDELLGYRSQPLIDDLKLAAGITGASVLDEFCPLMAWSGVQRVSGWQASWNMPKPEEQACSRGSVFVFGLKNDEQVLTAEQIKELITILTRLEETGLGERPAEGFGRLRVCDEFHWENPSK